MRSFYHKYFEGYEEEKIPKENGQGRRIEHKYVGIYYCQGVTRPMQFLIRFFYVAIFFGAFTLFFNASSKSLGCNTAAYVIVCQGLTILSFIWFVWVLIHYVLTEREMKIYTYKNTSLKLIKSSMVAAGAFGLDALSVLVYVLLHLQDEPKKQLICLAEYALGGSFLFLVNRLEKQIQYKKILNSEKGK